MRDTFLGFTVHVHHKGGNSQQEMKNANQLSQQQLDIMKQQLSMQQNQLGMVNPSLNAIIQNGGMLPAQQSAMTSLAMNSLPQTYNNAIGAINQDLVQRGIAGGGMAGGGGAARDFGQLFSQMGNQQQNMLSNIQLAKGSGLMNALGVGLGEGQMFGNQALGFGQQGTNALGIGQQAAGQADQASTNFWGSVIGALGGLGSAGIGKI